VAVVEVVSTDGVSVEAQAVAAAIVASRIVRMFTPTDKINGTVANVGPPHVKETPVFMESGSALEAASDYRRSSAALTGAMV
jgi:hypothetical protein